MRPKSSSLTLICRRSMARTVSSSIGISYVLPVRLSVIVRLLSPEAAPAPSCCWVSVSVVIALLYRQYKGQSDSITRAHAGRTFDRRAGTPRGRRIRVLGVRLLTGRDGETNGQRGEHETDQ